MKTKKISIFVICVLFFSSMMSCEKEMMKYEGEEGVYFAVQYGATWGDTTKWSYFPMTMIEFVNAETNDSIHTIRVASTGSIKSYNRTFMMIVEKDSTTAVEGLNYDKIPESYTIKAGEYFCDVPITLHKNRNIELESKKVSFKLLPTDDFTLSIPVWNSSIVGLWPNNAYPTFDDTRHYIEMTNFLVRPKVWPGQPLANAAVGTQEAGNFGQFTVKKFNLICEVMAQNGRPVSYSDFASNVTMPNPLTNVINQIMVAYVKKMFEAKTPVLEEDGRLMFFMNCGWVSKIGVPYVPEV